MNELIIRKEQLPDNIEGLKNFIIIGEGVLKAHKLQLNTIKKIGTAQDYYNAKLTDGQKVAEIVLEAQGKLGKVLEGIDKKKSYTGFSKRNSVMPPTITKKESYIAQSVMKNPEVVKEVIERAKENKEIPTTREVLEEIQIRIKQAHRIKPESIGEIIQPKDKKYKTITIDPPWPIKKIERNKRPNQGLYLDYPIMTLDEIEALPIPELADKNGCHIYLWITHKYLFSAPRMLDAWGANYECPLTWIKNVGFTPFSWMYSTEHCLFARIGNLPLVKLGKRLDFQAKVREHSRKPDEFYSLVKEVSPEPRLDMFSREKRERFDQYGCEINKFDAKEV